MTLAEIHQAIETYIATEWVATPYNFDSLPPLDLALPGQPPLSAAGTPYVIFDSAVSAERTISVPHKCTRYTGFISAEIYAREDTGRRKAAELRDTLNGLFSYKRISGDLRVKGYLDTGSVEDRNGWVIYICQWPFETENSI